MNVLLLSMPDYFENMPPVAVRMPNGALTALAGNVDGHHRVAVADLILSYRRLRETINGLFHELDPEVVGLSVMTFQRQTAHCIIDLARVLKPGVKIVVGGYDPSLAPEAYEGMRVDYIVRGVKPANRTPGQMEVCRLATCCKRKASLARAGLILVRLTSDYFLSAVSVRACRGVMETTMYSRSLSSMSSTRSFILSLSMRNCAFSPTGRSTGCLSSLGRIL